MVMMEKQMHFHIRNFVPLHTCTYTNIVGLQLAKYEEIKTVNMSVESVPIIIRSDWLSNQIGSNRMVEYYGGQTHCNCPSSYHNLTVSSTFQKLVLACVLQLPPPACLLCFHRLSHFESLTWSPTKFLAQQTRALTSASLRLLFKETSLLLLHFSNDQNVNDVMLVEMK